MATDRQSVEIISKWILLVANLCAADSTLTKDKLRALVENLAAEFPSAAFTSDCARAVTEGNEFFPGYDRFRTRVGIWWSKHRPVQKVLPGHSDAAGLTGNDLMWFNFYQKRAAEGFGAVKESYGEYPASSREHVLSLIRAQSRAAWGVITGNTSHRVSEATDDERAAVADSARRAREAMQPPREPRAHSLDQQMAAVRASPVLAKALPVPSAEVLAQREANPLVQAARRSADELFS